MRALIEAGIEIDVYSMYPLDSGMWDYSLETLNEDALSRDKIHHLSLAQSLSKAGPFPAKRVGTYLRDVVAACASASRYGTSASNPIGTLK